MESAAPSKASAPDELERLWRFMEKRRFVAGKDELLGAGFTASRIKNWLRGRRLLKLFRGVYSYGRDVETREAAWRAALLAAGPGSALTGRSALELWGVAKLRRAIPELIRAATPVDRKGRHSGLSPALRGTSVEVVHRRFETGDVRRKDGLALVRAPLALIEFAAGASETDVRFAFLEMSRLRLFAKKDVSFCLERLAGRPGASKVKPLLVLWVPQLNRIRSVLEGSFLLTWIDRRLKLPEVNVKVFGREVDFFWREQGVVLELDGDAFHTDPIARKRDLEKTQFLESRGLRVIRVTWKEFMADPAGVVNRMTRELGLL